MSDPVDIIAAIDSATGCQQCGKDPTGSVSDDFCSEECQRAWAASRVTPLTGYREPLDLDGSEPVCDDPRCCGPVITGGVPIDWAGWIRPHPHVTRFTEALNAQLRESARGWTHHSLVPAAETSPITTSLPFEMPSRSALLRPDVFTTHFTINEDGTISQNLPGDVMQVQGLWAQGQRRSYEYDGERWVETDGSEARVNL